MPSLADSEHSSTEQYQGFTNEIAEDIKSLARTATNNSETGESVNHSLARALSRMSAPGISPMGQDNIDPRLDPNSDSFDSKFWVKNMHQLACADPDYYKPSSLGVVYKNLRAYGQAADADYQANFGNAVYKTVSQFIQNRSSGHRERTRFDILKPMDGIIEPGSVTVVLGRPGAGCSTFLKSLAAQTHGFHIDKDSVVSYDGLSPKDIKKHFRGDVIYCAETESHFPQMTVQQTLEFAARMRTPRNRPEGISREEYAKHMSEVAMATYGLSHTRNTKVGNEYIRGVSGGERKRVSIAEVHLSRACLQCWDNSTRGLDSATALEFVRALKTSAMVTKTTPLIAIYQCSQDAYDLFDNVILLYEGYQIYHGSARKAKEFFTDMGYHCPQRQTTADFLTSLTNPVEREVRKGYEDKVPRTPKEFYDYWQKSKERSAIVKKIDEYLDSSEIENKRKEFSDSHHARQARNSRSKSPFTVSFGMQVKYLMARNFSRTKGDPSITLFSVIGNVIMSVIVSTMFIDLDPDTDSFYRRTAVLFFAVLLNAFGSLLEIFSLYEARPIVEKHKTYALYHPAADAFASIMTELPPKLIQCIAFNVVLYFTVHLRRSAGHFFFYLLVNFSCTIAMSHLFRCIGAATKSLSSAMTPASLLLLALTIFTGFVIPPQDMHGWCRWINYIDVVAYAFEALIANEFHGRDFPCSTYVPTGPGYQPQGDSVICAVTGANAGESFVNGDVYIDLSFDYRNAHKWRNWGIVVAFAVFFFIVYIFLVEINKGAMQNGEILVFQESALRKRRKQLRLLNDIESETPDEKLKTEDLFEEDNETDDSDNKLPNTTDIFHWRDLTYQVKIKSEERVILDGVDGWVKPGQVTALMGASGAGKTTLLNALSERLTSGEVTKGKRMVNGRELDSAFQRSIGYVQQQDLHLETTTVREALKFSAYLRQPSSCTKAEKDDYVEYIIRLLEMSKFADAVVGVPGEGLNVEQRKRLTIAVELVAKPRLLVFLDEPTSGLDSQTAWSICKLIRKLADHGQSILCTIHQPSAILMKEFDRLLFLQKGGQTVYFGDLGENSQAMIDYFEGEGAPKCPPEANPAEWMLEVIGAAPGSHADRDYHQVWLQSKARKEVIRELDDMERELPKRPVSEDPEKYKKYAVSFWTQYRQVVKRVFQQYWRTPSYTYSKVLLSIVASMFNGFTFFKADKTLQGLQNQMFSVFMFMVVFNTLIQQYLPHFVSQRDLYEVRERPSRTYSWVTFILAVVTAEIPWNIVCGTLAFFVWYYPIGLYNNAVPTDTVNERGATMWFAIVCFYIYTSTMGQLCISFSELANNAANLASLLFSMSLMFCGVLSSKDDMPRFWIFMYRVSPFTYFVSVVLSVALANSEVTCSDRELLRFTPTSGTCGEYMEPYMSFAGGYLVDENATEVCEFCTVKSTNAFLSTIDADYSQRWRDMGIFIAFIFINIIGTLFFYWLARVPKRSREKASKK
ncbi:hypothetical protein FT663_04945 [Candidozyma haemuli var. vulneris]|nr:hypothetical protein FT662_05020 [[Candida] haemuloni var. vulneris]KAF3986294.1 hypothetical protein FT663_04945 [[Candida] haemuloni var. vulneris]